MTRRPPHLGPPPPPSEVATEIAGDARIALGKVRARWPLLTEARVPGRPGPPATRPVDPKRAAVAAAEYLDARRVQLLAAARGMKPAGITAAPVRLAIVQARQTVTGQLADLAARMWESIYDAGLVMLTREPDERVVWRTCTWCTGGVLFPPDGWIPYAWPADPIACPRCRGRGKIPNGDLCHGCGSLGPCTCDRADVAVSLHLATIGELLDLVDVEAASDADATLHEVADRLDVVLGLGPDRRRLPGLECPVCGSREMVPEVGSHDRREWSITCYGPDCLCDGILCPCGIGTMRRAGHRHRWPAVTWDSAHGLRHAIAEATARAAKLAVQRVADATADVVGWHAWLAATAAGQPSTTERHDNDVNPV